MPAKSGTFRSGEALVCAFLRSSPRKRGPGILRNELGVREIGPKITPVEIFPFDQRNFPGPIPFLKCRSRSTADSRDPCASYQTSVFTLYFCVKPDATLLRCCQTRFTRSSVIPT